MRAFPITSCTYCRDMMCIQCSIWGGVKNGAWLRLAEAQFDVFLMADKNLRYQQNLDGRKLTVIVFPSNKLSVVKALESQWKKALAQIQPSTVIEL